MPSQADPDWSRQLSQAVDDLLAGRESYVAAELKRILPRYFVWESEQPKLTDEQGNLLTIVERGRLRFTGEAEIARLRAALEKIAEESTDRPGHIAWRALNPPE